MNQIVALCVLLSVSFSLSPTPAIDIDDPITFINGLLAGLEQDPGSNAACSAAVNALNPLIENVVVDVQGIIQQHSEKVLALIADLKAIEVMLPSLKMPCNVQALEDTMKGLLTLSGFKAFLNNLQEYEEVIKENISEMENCHANLSLCGENLGEIIRLALNWGV